MKQNEIQSRLEGIKAMANDPESAHNAERELWRDFIKEVANSPLPNLSAKAGLILSTEQISFPRWAA